MNLRDLSSIRGDSSPRLLNIDWRNLSPDHRDLRDPQTLGEEILANLSVQETPTVSDDGPVTLGWEGD